VHTLNLSGLFRDTDPYPILLCYLLGDRLVG